MTGTLGHLVATPTTEAGIAAGKVAEDALTLFFEYRDVHDHADGPKT